MKWGWMIAKWVWDETTKLSQYVWYQSWDSLSDYRLQTKEEKNNERDEIVFNFWNDRLEDQRQASWKKWRDEQGFTMNDLLLNADKSEVMFFALQLNSNRLKLWTLSS